MKFKTLAISAAVLLAGAAALPAAHAEGTGRVNFNGLLTADTCDLTTDSRDQTVKLPTVSVQSLTAAGQVAGSTPFTIEVTNCPDTFNQVAVHFEMNNMEAATRTLNNIAPAADAAGNVTVQLIEADGTPIPAGSAGKPHPIVGEDETRGAKMMFGGQYYALGATTPGVVQSYAQFTIAYP